MVTAFTNTKDADLKQEFGKEYSYEHESGQKRMFLSVSQFKPVFERQESRIEVRGAAKAGDHPSAPQKRRQFDRK